MLAAAAAGAGAGPVVPAAGAGLACCSGDMALGEGLGANELARASHRADESLAGWAALEKCFDLVDQLGDLDGLGVVVGAAGFERAFAVAGHGVGGQGD